MVFKVEFIPEAINDFDSLDGSLQKEIAKKIDALAGNPFLGKPLGNKFGLDLTGFYKLYAAKKKYRVVYRLLGKNLEVIEIFDAGKREKKEIYKLILHRLKKIS